jgi:prepilin-type N-terminal cleavage/methylation domain-containing protein
MKKNKGFSLIELIIVVVIMGVIVAIATPNLLASRRAANSAAAAQTMRLFHSAESTYQAGIGAGNFGTSQDLATQNFIDEALADACTTTGSPKSGYVFTVTPLVPTGNKLADFNVVAVTAITTGINRTGDKNFYVDATGVIRASSVSATPTSTDEPIQ